MPGDTIGQHQAKPQNTGVKGKSKYPENYFKPAFFRAQLIEDKEKYASNGTTDTDCYQGHIDPLTAAYPKEHKKGCGESKAEKGSLPDPFAQGIGRVILLRISIMGH